MEVKSEVSSGANSQTIPQGISYGEKLKRLLQNIKLSWQIADDFTSGLRLAADFILYHLLKFLPVSSCDRERTVRCANGITLTYRLNRGDLQSIREVFLQESYRLPFSFQPRSLVDLGANIGITSVWFSRHYPIQKLIAIEPNPANAEILRRNLLNNKINASVIEAAIGSTDRSIIFHLSGDSNQGTILATEEQNNRAGEMEVKMISMSTVLADLESNEEIDLVKMDIEGGEEELLSANLSWLRRVKAIIAELHPPLIDYQKTIKIIEEKGFRYIPANTVHPNNMDAFLRDSR
ncbi:MAG: FkbM family methyltransferase [Cyanosarcina radialis HA8281-LM2]|jgi:FkbM family methyltransferase|nr:FkbM family methyltransferase [Cyanosarcina radialis HA8281-LM2]